MLPAHIQKIVDDTFEEDAQWRDTTPTEKKLVMWDKEDLENFANRILTAQDTGEIGEEIWNAALETMGTGIGEMSRYSSYKDYLNMKKRKEEGKV